MAVISLLLSPYISFSVMMTQNHCLQNSYEQYFSTRRSSSIAAQLCNISNPRRVYYLRQEVANTSINALAQAVAMILDLEMSINRGGDGRDLLVVILGVCRLFQVV